MRSLLWGPIVPNVYRFNCLDDFLAGAAWEGQIEFRAIIADLVERCGDGNPLDDLRRTALHHWSGDAIAPTISHEQLSSHQATLLQQFAVHYAAQDDVASAAGYASSAALAFFNSNHVDHALSLLGSIQEITPFDPMHFRLRQDGLKRKANALHAEIERAEAVEYALNLARFLENPWKIKELTKESPLPEPKNSTESLIIFHIIQLYAMMRSFCSDEIAFMAKLASSSLSGVTLAKTCFAGAYHAMHGSVPDGKLHREMVGRYWEVIRSRHPRPIPLSDSRTPGCLRVGFIEVSGATLMANYYETTIGVSLAAISGNKNIETFFYLPRAQEIPVNLARDVDHAYIYPTDDDLNAATNQIASHDLDVLFMISGLIGHAPISLFSSHPARRLALWHHTHTSYGPDLFDAIIIDEITHTPYYTQYMYETPIITNGPTVLLAPPPNAPPVAPSPRRSAGHIAFGSFNRINKMTLHLLALWRKIILATPGSILHFANNQIYNENYYRQLKSMLLEVNFPEDRIIIHSSHEDYIHFLNIYGKVDISFDTYPFNGGVTTIESLWQGVPVVSRADDTPLARTSLQFLSRLGLADLVAFDDDSYVDIACKLARDGERLDTLRTRLRDMLLTSPLMNPSDFANRFEDALHRILMTPQRSRPS